MDTTNFASGQVVTGFSYPLVALYSATAGEVSYSSLQDLARGVSITPNLVIANADNTLYLNNRASERGKPHFRSGTLNVNVDGLKVAAEKLVMGIPGSAKEDVTVGNSTTVEFTIYNDDQSIPYVGLGVVLQIQSNGNTFFIGFVYRKLQFAQFDVPATTEGQDIDWQTTSLSAAMFVDDTAKHAWKWFSEPLATELEAYNACSCVLGGSAVAALPSV